LKTEIPYGIINPETNLPYKEYETIGMWSREEGSSEWGYEKDAKVKNVNGQLILEEYLTHLSDYMFAHYYELCDISVKVNFTGKVSPNDGAVFGGMNDVYFYLVDTDGNEELVDYKSISLSQDGTFFQPSNGRMYVYRNTAKIKIVPAPYNYKKLVFSQTLFDVPAGCSNLDVNIAVSEIVEPDPNKLDINFDLAVSSGPLTVKPSLEIKYRKTGSGSAYSSTTLSFGKGKMGIDLNADYDIVVTLGARQGKGKMKIESISATQFKVTFSELSFEGQSSGTPVVFNVVKAADGSLTVAYNVEVDADVLNQLK